MNGNGRVGANGTTVVMIVMKHLNQSYIYTHIFLVLI